MRSLRWNQRLGYEPRFPTSDVNQFHECAHNLFPIIREFTSYQNDASFGVTLDIICDLFQRNGWPRRQENSNEIKHLHSLCRERIGAPQRTTILWYDVQSLN